ncbi:MAG: hypothetical protein CMO55_16890 [Verrucomicrobiales bacterium]|nr:hypothetical protein [Verrucomicrobiales bacterium]
MSANAKTWQPTRHQHLYRHKSGTYYVRLGKRTWRSLRTKVKSVALKKRDEELALEAKRQESAPQQEERPLRTVGDAITARQGQIRNDPSLKESTKKFWDDIYNVVPKIWPGIKQRPIRRLTPEECEAWAGPYSRTVSASHFNHVLSAFRTALDLAVNRGIRPSNPFSGIKQRKARSKDLTGSLPSREEFTALVEEIRNSPSRWGEACGDFVEFLAYSGVRVGEAPWILWKNCDLKRGELIVTGEPDEGTKNRQVRRGPIIPDLENLLMRIAEKRIDATRESPILAVKSASKALKRAATTLELTPLTHHDLRHFFATVCIESGVDIPTLSRWLGHSDGGVLAMKTYGHLRNEHSLAAAKKVSFS